MLIAIAIIVFVAIAIVAFNIGDDLFDAVLRLEMDESVKVIFLYCVFVFVCGFCYWKFVDWLFLS